MATRRITTNIKTENQLRQVIAAYPKVLDKRIKSQLDAYSIELINASKLSIVGFSSDDLPMRVLLSNDLVIKADDTIELHAHEGKIDVLNDTYASLYFLIPGVDHGLRVNGIVRKSEFQIVIKITSVYLHCARAAARAGLWSSLDQSYAVRPFTSNEMLSVSPFLLLKTMDANGSTEISPRGDEKGFVRQLTANQLFIPERPGNKVAISLRNILQNRNVELLFILPSSNYVLGVRGLGSVTTEDRVLDLAIVNNKRPKLGIIMDKCEFELKKSSSLTNGSIWSSSNYVSPDRLTRFSRALSIHMNGEGIAGKATTPIVEAIVKHDMKNLY